MSSHPLSLPSSLRSCSYVHLLHLANPNLDGFASAKFVVNAGENRLSRPIGGGSVLAGALKGVVTTTPTTTSTVAP